MAWKTHKSTCSNCHVGQHSRIHGAFPSLFVALYGGVRRSLFLKLSARRPFTIQQDPPDPPPSPSTHQVLPALLLHRCHAGNNLGLWTTLLNAHVLNLMQKERYYHPESLRPTCSHLEGVFSPHGSFFIS